MAGRLGGWEAGGGPGSGRCGGHGRAAGRLEGWKAGRLEGAAGRLAQDEAETESSASFAVGSGRLPDLPSDDKAAASEILLHLQLYLEFDKKEKSIAKLMQACNKNNRIKQRLLTWNAHHKNDGGRSRAIRLPVPWGSEKHHGQWCVP